MLKQFAQFLHIAEFCFCKLASCWLTKFFYQLSPSAVCHDQVISPYFHRISGGTASDKDIHGSVSEQMKKAFAKHRWKVLSFFFFFILW